LGIQKFVREVIMLRLSHAKLVLLSGLVWALIGGLLLNIGLNLLMGLPNQPLESDKYPLLTMLSPYVGSGQECAIVLVAVALFIGFFKGRYVLGKSAKRGIERLLTFPNPTSLRNIYSAKYYILLGVMCGIGMSIKFLGIPNDVRGFVDVAIGAALINGAMIYFRAGIELQNMPAASKSYN
jgi:hypothetical protein